jgi:four helix bundle protein
MPHGRHEDLCDRTFEFACDVFDFCEELTRVPGLPRRLGYQLFDAAGSVGANREEAKAAYSRLEFAAKNSISLKECREARFWLRLAEAKSLGDAARRSRLLRESDQLAAIFTATVKALQLGGRGRPETVRGRR